jgi:hypothetical protein
MTFKNKKWAAKEPPDSQWVQLKISGISLPSVLISIPKNAIEGKNE